MTSSGGMLTVDSWSKSPDFRPDTCMCQSCLLAAGVLLKQEHKPLACEQAASPESAAACLRTKELMHANLLINNCCQLCMQFSQKLLSLVSLFLLFPQLALELDWAQSMCAVTSSLLITQAAVWAPTHQGPASWC